MIVLGENLTTQKDILISDTERTSGMYVIGGTGVGKTTLLTGIFLQDIFNGHGGLFIDVDGDSINALLPCIPKERMNDVILLDLHVVDKKRGVQPTDRFIGFNPLEEANIEWVVEVFKNLWEIGPETPRLELTLRNSLLTLAYNQKTIAEMPYLLRDKEYRQICIANIPDTFSNYWVRWFWEQDFNIRYVQEQLAYADSTLNKILQLLIMPDVQYVVSQNKSTLNFRQLMDERKIILLCMPDSQQKLGKQGVRFLGTFLLASVKDALLARADSDERSFFSLCADEWQLYLTPDFKDMLTRGRKYGLAATIANQTLSQLREVDKELEGITQQVNIHVTFRVGSDDARILAPYYAKDPPPAEPRREEKLEPMRDVVRHLARVEYPHPVVNSFVQRWKFFELTQKIFISSGHFDDTLRDKLGYRESPLDQINDWLYEAMTEKQSRQHGLPLLLFEAGVRMIRFPFFESSQFFVWALEEYPILTGRYGPRGRMEVSVRETRYKRRTKPLEKVYGSYLEKYHFPYDYCSFLFRDEVFDEEPVTEEEKAIYARLWEAEDEERLQQAFAAYEALVRDTLTQRIKPTADTCISLLYSKLHTRKEGDEKEPGWCREHRHWYNLSDEEKKKTWRLRDFAEHDIEEIQKALGTSLLNFNPTTLEWEEEDITGQGEYFSWRVKPGQLEHLVTPARIAEEVDRIIVEKKPHFEAFVREIREVLQILADQPITAGSGIYEMVSGLQRTHADMVGEMAHELVNLPNKTAYVAVGSRGARYKPQMKTKPLPYTKQLESLLHIHKTQALEQAKQYTVDAAVIEQEIQARRKQRTPFERYDVSTSIRIAKRRAATFTPVQAGQTPALSGYKLADSDILYRLYQFRHLTIDQLARTLQRESIVNRVREIVNERLVSQGLVTATSPGGRSAYIYSLTKKGKRALEADKGTLPDVSDTGYSSHLHNVNNLLIPALLLPSVEPRIGLLDWQHGEAFKVTPVSLGNNRAVVPDGFVSYVLSPPFGKIGEPVGIIFEWDEGTESINQLRDKFLRYIAFASGIYQDTFHLDSLTIAFCASEKDRILRMKTLAEEVTRDRKDYAELFLFAGINTGETDPLTLCTTPLFHQPFDTNLHALIELGA